MADSMDTPKTFVLKLKIHCEGCEKKLKHLLRKIHGVHKITMDAQQEKVTISGTVDPQTIIDVLEKKKVKAKLLPEQSPQSDNRNMQIILQPKPHQEFQDQDLVPQLQRLSEIQGVKHVEVTYSRTFKVTFKGKNEEQVLSHESDAQRKIVMRDDHDHDQVHGFYDLPSKLYSVNGPPQFEYPPPDPAPPWATNFPPETRPPGFNYDPSAPPWPGADGFPYSTFTEENPKRYCSLM